MSLHALLARAEEAHRAAEADVAECSKALDMLKVSTDGRKKDAATYKRLAVRTRGMIEALNDLDQKAREALDLASLFAAQSAAPAEDEAFDEPEIAPPPAPEPPAEEPKAPLAPTAVPAAKTFNDRVLAEIVRARQPNGYASVELAAISQALRVSQGKVRIAVAELKAAKRIGGVNTRAGAEPGWATFKVLDVVEQAA